MCTLAASCAREKAATASHAGGPVIKRLGKERGNEMTQQQMEKDLVMAGYMGLSGSVFLARHEYAGLTKRLPEELLEETEVCYHDLAESFAMKPEWLSDFERAGEAACFALARGGLFNGLWRMAQEWQVGFVVELKEIPVRQETIEICECLEMNPYYVSSENSFLIAAEHGERLCRVLRERGWPAAVIGTLNGGKDKILRHGDTVSCLNRPQEDEVERFLRERQISDGRPAKAE